MDDLLRKRIDDVVSKSRSSGIAVGEWLDPDVRLPYEPAYRMPHAMPRMDRGLDAASDSLRRGFDSLQQEFRSAGDLNADAGPLEDLLREVDRRGHRVIDAAVATEHLWSATPDRTLRERGDAQSSDREQLFAFVTERWNARPQDERDQLRTPTDRSAMPAFDRTTLTSPLDFGRGAEAELPHRALRSDETQEDPADWLRRRFAHQAPASRVAEPLNSISRQLDELAREVTEREGGASNDEIEAFKHRLTALARETERQAERKLSHGEPVERGLSSAPMPHDIGARRPVEAVPDVANLYAQLELRTRRNDDWRDAGDNSSPVGPSAAPADLRGAETLESDLSVILNSVALERQSQLQPQAPEFVREESVEATPPKQGELVAMASERWLARSNDPREKPAAVADRATGAANDRVKRTASPVTKVRAAKKKRSRSTIAPIVRAGLAGVLAIAVVVTGAYFARSRMSGTSEARPTTIVHEGAKTAEARPAGLLTIMPPNSVARFQDLVFPLPNLYGIYAINSGRLFELDALPGQAPDPRVAVSAAIARASHTVLPDGRVAFLLFRRDLASQISERVPIRVVAKIKRSLSGPADEQHTARADDTWTIRNISVDFRVAPVETNKEMVLLVSEKSEFTFSPGRYALILKGQAYDFTIAGPVTDPAQCLERVEAANGSFFHECQSPQVGADADLSSQDTPAVSPRPSKLRRQAEVQPRR